MVDRDTIIAAIKDLKRERLPGWRVHVNRLFRELQNMEDPFKDLEYSGNEHNGRKCHYEGGRGPQWEPKED